LLTRFDIPPTLLFDGMYDLPSVLNTCYFIATAAQPSGRQVLVCVALEEIQPTRYQAELVGVATALN
jgi:hypothetical protein